MPAELGLGVEHVGVDAAGLTGFGEVGTQPVDGHVHDVDQHVRVLARTLDQLTVDDRVEFGQPVAAQRRRGEHDPADLAPRQPPLGEMDRRDRQRPQPVRRGDQHPAVRPGPGRVQPQQGFEPDPARLGRQGPFLHLLHQADHDLGDLPVHRPQRVHGLGE